MHVIERLADWLLDTKFLGFSACDWLLFLVFGVSVYLCGLYCIS